MVSLPVPQPVVAAAHAPPPGATGTATGMGPLSQTTPTPYPFPFSSRYFEVWIKGQVHTHGDSTQTVERLGSYTRSLRGVTRKTGTLRNQPQTPIGINPGGVFVLRRFAQKRGGCGWDLAGAQKNGLREIVEVPFLWAGGSQERLRGGGWWVGMGESVVGAGNVGLWLWDRGKIGIWR